MRAPVLLASAAHRRADGHEEIARHLHGSESLKKAQEARGIYGF